MNINDNGVLMLEMTSPNVSKIIPMEFSEILHFGPNRFIAIPHQNGIVEFEFNNMSYDNSRNISVMVNHFFSLHQNLIYDVGVNGLKDENTGVGSRRFCTMNYEFAKWLTSIVKYRSVLDIIKDENGNWMEMVNVSQYFRFMKYVSGGEHFPHFDSDFHYEYNDTYTKYSIVIYFTKCDTGEIAFVNDKGTEFEGKTCDWSRQAKEEEIYLKFLPSPLKIICFPHTLCHTVLPYVDPQGSRIICRGDILYRKIK